MTYDIRNITINVIKSCLAVKAKIWREIVKNKTLYLIREQKKKDEKYLFELQKFLDTAENIKDEEFKKRIISQMLKCDEALTLLIEKLLHK